MKNSRYINKLIILFLVVSMVSTNISIFSLSDSFSISSVYAEESDDIQSEISDDNSGNDSTDNTDENTSDETNPSDNGDSDETLPDDNTPENPPIVLGRAFISSVSKNGSKMKVTLAKSASSLGGAKYQIQYKNPYIRGSVWKNKYTSKRIITITGLSSSYKYLVRARVYTTDGDGNKVYGPWSTIKPNIRYTSTGFRFFSSLKSLINQKSIRSNSSIRSLLSKYASNTRSHAIPGLNQTLSTESSGHIILKDMVPQALCEFNNYYLMTAYSYKKEYKAVVYVMDSNWKLVTTVTLPNNYHNGGIAYDPDGDVLWFVGYTPDDFIENYDWRLNCVTGDKFRKAIEKGKENMKSTYLVSFSKTRVPIKNRPSCLDYSNGRLWVGTFLDKKASYIYGYKTNATSINTDSIIKVRGLDSKLNGFTWDGKSNLYLSYSFGRKSKHTANITRVKFSNPVTSSVNIKNHKRKKVNMPKMNEELIVKNGYLYIVFESASRKYYNSYNKVDRILAISKKAWYM